jgi:two-component system, LytTR family, response regulator
MTLRTLIVDDEAPARRRLRRLLMAEGGITIVGECGDGASALAAIASFAPDLVLLDVQMPEQDGFAVVQALPAGAMPAILFVTAFDRYALRAFDVHAVDYLLKPFTTERFRTALARARERIAARAGQQEIASLAAALHSRPPAIARVAVSVGRRTLFVDVRGIDWLDAADNYVRLHAGGKEYLARETLASLEAQLDPDRFARIHRSAIVQIDRIVELRPTTHGDAEVRLRDGTLLAVSRTWREGLDRALGGAKPNG